MGEGGQMRRNHRNLRVWQSALDLVDDVYRFTAKFPKEELYGLSSQMRRAAVSVPSNIVEGCARSGTKELIHFLNIASGSLSELDTQIEIARRQGYLADAELLVSRIDGVFAMLVALMASLKRKD